MDAKEHAVAMNYSSINFSVFRSSVWFLVGIASVLSFFPYPLQIILVFWTVCYSPLTEK